VIVPKAKKKDMAFTISITLHEAKTLRHLAGRIASHQAYDNKSRNYREAVHNVTQRLAQGLYRLGGSAR
jgi:hypothetical protein